jgi:hypothetical protein
MLSIGFIYTEYSLWGQQAGDAYGFDEAGGSASGLPGGEEFQSHLYAVAGL